MSFPVNGVLDNFNRVDEDPLAGGGNWSGPIITFNNQMKLVSNAAVASTFLAGVAADSYWSAASFGPGAECFVTIPVMWANDNSDIWIWMHGRNENTANQSGYLLYIFQVSGAFTWQLYRKDNGADTQLGANIGTQALSNGDSIGLQCSSNGVFQAWYKASAGSWTTVGSTRSDTTYTSGHIGLDKGFQDTTSTIDNFGGGSIITIEHDEYDLPVVVCS